MEIICKTVQEPHIFAARPMVLHKTAGKGFSRTIRIYVRSMTALPPLSFLRSPDELRYTCRKRKGIPAALPLPLPLLFMLSENRCRAYFAIRRSLAEMQYVSSYFS